jgi:hypothetical protein
MIQPLPGKVQIGLASWGRVVRIRALFVANQSGFSSHTHSHIRIDSERSMKAALVALAVVTIAALTAGPAEAHRHHRYAHYAHYYGCHQSDDYTHGNALSGMSSIYPAANWGPFFRCRMYYSPVISAPSTATYVY